MSRRIAAIVFLILWLLVMVAPFAFGQATRPGPLLIDTQAELNALRGRIPDNATVVLNDGSYDVPATIQLGSNATLMAQAASRVVLNYTGPVAASGASVVLSLNRDGATVQGVHVNARGANVFSVRGAKCRVIGNTAADVNYFVKVDGADDLLIAGNTCPVVRGYFVYAAGTVTERGPPREIVVNPVNNLRILGNACDESTAESTVRFHETFGLELAYNRFGHPAVWRTDGTPRFVQKAIIKGHDGADWSIHHNRLWGGRKGGNQYTGMVGLCPLGGGDGGLRETDPLRQKRKLALSLSNVRFTDNVCDDVVIKTEPGVTGLVIENNTFDFCRDVVFGYQSAAGGYDYRPWRAEPTGVIRNNLVRRAATNTKPLHTMPAGVRVE